MGDRDSVGVEPPLDPTASPSDTALLVCPGVSELEAVDPVLLDIDHDRVSVFDESELRWTEVDSATTTGFPGEGLVQSL